MDRTALTIAGFDPSSGAGVTADVLTLAAHGVFATAAITALTVQSTRGVQAVHPTAPKLLQETLDCLEDDLAPTGIKIGMLATPALADVVAAYLGRVRAQRQVVVVLDPVLRSSSGAALLDDANGLHALLGLVDAVTPNLVEASRLAGIPCGTPAEMELCAAALCERYASLTVVVTGGHLPQPSDLLMGPDGSAWFSGEHIVTASTHGTGCAFSSALLAARLRGEEWSQATASAKRFVSRALQTAVPRGHGRGPMALLPQLGRFPQGVF